MSKKAIYTVSGIYFSKQENAKAEAEKNGSTEKPKKSFVSEDEFMQMLEDGLIVDFEMNESETAAPSPLDVNEVLKRLEALEQENKRLKEQKPVNLEEMKRAIERREQLEKERALLNMQADSLIDLDILNGQYWDSPSVVFSAKPSGAGRNVDFEVSNPVVVEEFRDFMVKKMGEKCKAISEELTSLESIFA